MPKIAEKNIPFLLLSRLDEILTGIFMVGLVIMAALRDAPVMERFTSSWLFLHTMLGAIAVSVAMSSGKRPFVALLKDWLPLLLALAVYESMKHMNASAMTFWLGIHPKDDLMMAVDVFLFGQTPSVYFKAWGFSSPVAFNIMWFFYNSYYFIPFVVLGYLQWAKDRENFYIARRGVILALYGGYCFYVLIPVMGPISAFKHIVPQNLFDTLPAYEYLMENFRYNFDCFPSLHVAVPWTLLILCHKLVPREAAILLLVFCCGIALSTMTTGLHYGIDVIAGFAWAATVCFLAKRSKQVEKRLAEGSKVSG